MLLELLDAQPRSPEAQSLGAAAGTQTGAGQSRHIAGGAARADRRVALQIRRLGQPNLLLPREVVGVPLLEVFKVRLERSLSNLI